MGCELQIPSPREQAEWDDRDRNTWNHFFWFQALPKHFMGFNSLFNAMSWILLSHFAYGETALESESVQLSNLLKILS